MSKLLIIAEMFGILAAVVGIALVSVPLSLVVFGVVIVAACEVRGGIPKDGDGT